MASSPAQDFPYMLVNRDLERSTEHHWAMAAFFDVDYRRTLAVTVKIPSVQKEYA